MADAACNKKGGSYMKKTLIIVAAIALAAAAPAATNDPTRVADAMADALRNQLADAKSLRLHALVVGASGDGVALVGSTPAGGRPERAQ